MKIIKYIKILGFLFILTPIILNPFTLEPFSPDKQLDDINLFKIIAFDLVLFFLGMLAIFNKSKTTVNILLLLFVSAVAITITETTFYFLNSSEVYSIYIDQDDGFLHPKFFERSVFVSETDLPYIEIEGVGNVYSPDTVNNQSTYVDGKLIFDVNYTVDEFSRRITPDKQGAPHLLVFGGSFVFGAGLEDSQTLPYFLSELTDYQAYNYAFNGWGTQQMLAHLEREDFANEIANQQGISIYLFIPHHIRRVIGDMQLVSNFAESYPYFYLDKNDNLIHQGNFSNGRPLVTWIYKTLWDLNVVKYFRVNLPIENEKHTYLTYKIIEEAKNIYESKFNGTFYVLVSSWGKDTLESQNLMKLLEENSINILHYPANYSEEDYIPGDLARHPTAKFNEMLANLIVEDLNLANEER